MSLHRDLLEQARHLANRERTRPRQASLRRAISASYYALFHLLIYEGQTKLITPGMARERVARAFEHRDMKNLSREFATPAISAGQLDVLTGGLTIPNELQRVAATFVELQEARHEADYNVNTRFVRSEVNNLVDRTQGAFADWTAIRGNPVASHYLAALLFGAKWKR